MDAADREGIDPFDFVLAEKLGRTVAELHATIGQREYMHWSRYLGVKQQNREIAEAAAAAKIRG